MTTTVDALATISLDDLELVTGGGADGTQTSVNLGVNAKGVQVGLQGQRTTSNYVECKAGVLKLPGAKPSDIRESCGLPPSS